MSQIPTRILCLLSLVFLQAGTLVRLDYILSFTEADVLIMEAKLRLPFGVDANESTVLTPTAAEALRQPFFWQYNASD